MYEIQIFLEHRFQSHDVITSFYWFSLKMCRVSWVTPIQQLIICCLSGRDFCQTEFILERKRFFIAIFVFWGQERLTYRSISKRYLKSDITAWVEKSSTSRAIHAHDTLTTQDSIGHLKTLYMSVLSLVVVLESEWKRYSSSSVGNPF